MIPWPCGVVVHQNGTQVGLHIDLLIPSLATKRPQPQLNVQIIAHAFYGLNYSTGTPQVPPQAPQGRSTVGHCFLFRASSIRNVGKNNVMGGVYVSSQRSLASPPLHPTPSPPSLADPRITREGQPFSQPRHSLSPCGKAPGRLVWSRGLRC